MTEPAGPEELIDRAHAAVDWATAFKASLPEPGAAAGHISFRARSVLRQLADAGFLADPEQGSELERDRLFWQGLLEDSGRNYADLTAERDELKALNGKLTIALDAARVPHQAAYVDPEHRGGNCIDVIMERSAEAHKLRAERDGLKARVAEQEQLLAIVRAQNDDCVEQVDAVLGHRYHTRGVHYSIPHVAEQAAAEIKQLRGRIGAALRECAESVAMSSRVAVAFQPAEYSAVEIVANRIRAALLADQSAVPEKPFGARLMEASMHEARRIAALAKRDESAPVLPGDETPQPEEDQT